MMSERGVIYLMRNKQHPLTTDRGRGHPFCMVSKALPDRWKGCPEIVVRPFFATICAGTRRSDRRFPEGRYRGLNMKKILATAAAALMIASFTATAASAKKVHRGYKAHHGYYGAYGQMRGPAIFRGNAAMSGNHGNSAYGSNSLGHIKGGNIGGGT
jgi:hypothetical protein